MALRDESQDAGCLGRGEIAGSAPLQGLTLDVPADSSPSRGPQVFPWKEKRQGISVHRRHETNPVTWKTYITPVVQVYTLPPCHPKYKMKTCHSLPHPRNPSTTQPQVRCVHEGRQRP